MAENILSAKQKRSAADRYIAGESTSDLAKAFGVTKDKILREIICLGVKRRTLREAWIVRKRNHPSVLEGRLPCPKCGKQTRKHGVNCGRRYFTCGSCQFGFGEPRKATCQQCGQEFSPNRSDQKFCCLDCSMYFHGRKRLVARRDCANCCKAFCSRKMYAVYCSKKCRELASIKRRRGSGRRAATCFKYSQSPKGKAAARRGSKGEKAIARAERYRRSPKGAKMRMTACARRRERRVGLDLLCLALQLGEL